MIYIIRMTDGQQEVYKIGYSSFPKKRINHYITHNPLNESREGNIMAKFRFSKERKDILIEKLDHLCRKIMSFRKVLK